MPGKWTYFTWKKDVIADPLVGRIIIYFRISKNNITKTKNLATNQLLSIPDDKYEEYEL